MPRANQGRRSGRRTNSDQDSSSRPNRTNRSGGRNSRGSSPERSERPFRSESGPAKRGGRPGPKKFAGKGGPRKSDDSPYSQKPYSPKKSTSGRPKRAGFSDEGRTERYSSSPRRGKGDFKSRSSREDGGTPRRSYSRSSDAKSERSSPPRRGGSRGNSAPRRSREQEDKQDRKGFFNKQQREPREPREHKPAFEAAPVQTEKIRLNRYIANSGVCSRREADELISMGLISVNGKTVTELGFKVNPGDEVRYENRVLRAEKPIYILLNKPKGYLTTTDDPQERDTVMHIIGSAVKERIYPVGRLDRNTTGLLLLTNDGELADKLMHPSYGVKKIYKVDLDRPLTKADFETILAGVRLEEGKAMVDDLAIVSDDGKTVGMEIHIGWNRVVRRIFEALNYQVVKLDRSVYAGLDKKDLSRGQWRFLTKEEIVRLKHFK